MSSLVVELSIRLVASPPSSALKAVLLILWRQTRTDSPTSSSSPARVTRGSSPDIDTGAHPGDGVDLHANLLNLIEQRASGTKVMALLELSKVGVVDIIHYLFTVRTNHYDMSPELWGILGEVPEDGPPP